MKILFTGGGTGGHFYPIIAVVEATYRIIKEKRLLAPELIFMSDSPYDSELLQKEDLIFKKVYAGKWRRYFSFLNILDLFKTAIGILKAMWVVYTEMPDVIFGKGGYASFPALLAARVFKIPVIIHESDSIPGTVNKWAGKFVKKIAVSFEETQKYFPREKTILTGIPVRTTILGSTSEEAKEVFGLEPNLPVLLILGGSQGASKINETILQALPELIKHFQIIHQCGKLLEKETRGRARVVLETSVFKDRYHLYPYLNDTLMRNGASIADLVISRGGATSIYEIASWGLASIIIPLKGSAQNHQRANAYNYKRSGATEVIEENNLSPNVLISEIKRLIENKEKKEKMKQAAKAFAKPEATRKIANEIINLALEHSK